MVTIEAETGLVHIEYRRVNDRRVSGLGDTTGAPGAWVRVP